MLSSKTKMIRPTKAYGEAPVYRIAPPRRMRGHSAFQHIVAKRAVRSDKPKAHLFQHMLASFVF